MDAQHGGPTLDLGPDGGVLENILQLFIMVVI